MVVTSPQFRQESGGQTVEWQTTPGLLPYDEAVAAMEARVAAIRRGEDAGLVWLIEHPPLYTAGTSAKAADLLDANRFPVHQTGRGGQYTYHGPGQRIAYVMLDLNRRGRDLLVPTEQRHDEGEEEREAEGEHTRHRSSSS